MPNVDKTIKAFQGLKPVLETALDAVIMMDEMGIVMPTFAARLGLVSSEFRQ